MTTLALGPLPVSGLPALAMLVSAMLLIAGHLDTMTATADQTSQEWRAAGDPYCVPEVWQGGRTVTLGKVDSSGKFTVRQSMSIVIYSSKRQKMVVTDGLYRGPYVKYIFDYPAKILYTVTGSESSNSTCQKTNLPGPFKPQCVPGDASVTQGESTYGTGHNTVKSMELEGIQNGVNYSVSVTPDSFLPIFETLRATSQNGGSFFQTLSFYNVTVSSHLPDVLFKPLSVCDHAPWNVLSSGFHSGTEGVKGAPTSRTKSDRRKTENAGVSRGPCSERSREATSGWTPVF